MELYPIKGVENKDRVLIRNIKPKDNLTNHKKVMMLMWVHPSNTQIKTLKKKFNKLYTQLLPIINTWDPIGLVGSGAPDDEYDCITVQLIVLLEQGKSQNEIYEFIIHELDDHFSMGIDSISNDYREQFIKKHKEFSSDLIDWYISYKGNTN